MNTRHITFHAPVFLPEGPKEGTHHLSVLYSEEGYTLFWKPLDGCPVFVNPATNNKARLTIALTSDIGNIPIHGKVVLSFEEILVEEGSGQTTKEWKPSDWIPAS